MKPTIEEVRRAIERYMGTGEYGAAAIAAIDVAEAVHRQIHFNVHFWTDVLHADERFSATIATSKPEGT